MILYGKVVLINKLFWWINNDFCLWNFQRKYGSCISTSVYESTEYDLSMARGHALPNGGQCCFEWSAMFTHSSQKWQCWHNTAYCWGKLLHGILFDLICFYRAVNRNFMLLYIYIALRTIINIYDINSLEDYSCKLLDSNCSYNFIRATYHRMLEKA